MSSSGNPITRASRGQVRRYRCCYRVSTAKISRAGPGPARDNSGQPKSGFGLDLEHLAATIHAGLQVDVVRTAQFARILVLDIGWLLEGVGGPAHAAARGRGFSFRNAHGKSPATAPGLPMRPAAQIHLRTRAYRGSIRPRLEHDDEKRAPAFAKKIMPKQAARPDPGIR